MPMKEYHHNMYVSDYISIIRILKVDALCIMGNVADESNFRLCNQRNLSLNKSQGSYREFPILN